MSSYQKDRQYYHFCAYGFLKNLRFFDAFLLLFFLENGLYYTQIGLLYSAREIAINVLEIPSGLFADAWGRKYSLVLAFALYIFAFGFFYLATNFYHLLAAVLLMGIGDAFRSGTHKGMIMDYLRAKGWSQDKVSYYGATRAWSQKGSAISALMAGLLVLYSGEYRSIYLLSIIPYLGNFINILAYPQFLNKPYQKGPTKQLPSLKRVFQSFVKAIRQRGVRPIINSAALHSAYLKSIKDYIQSVMVAISLTLPILTDHPDKEKSGLVIGILYFVIFILNSQASRYAYLLAKDPKLKTAHITLLLGLGMGVISGWMIYFELWWLACLFFVFIFVIENLRKPVLTAMLAEKVPEQVLTSVLSSQSFYKTFLVSSLSLSFGIIADASNIGFALVIISVSLLVFHSLAIGARFTRKEPQI
ncbi:MAG: MFS transporter [Bacteroidota bacterium]